MCDLLWSDPDDRCGWGISPRGAGYTFGQVRTRGGIRSCTQLTHSLCARSAQPLWSFVCSCGWRIVLAKQREGYTAWYPAGTQLDL